MLVTSIFSSPEHNMLKGAFRITLYPLYIVHCVASTILFNIFSLLLNCWASFAGIILGRSSLKQFIEFDSIKNSGCHGNQMQFSKRFFQNLLLGNFWSDFEMISRKCSLTEPFQNLCAKF